MGFDYENGIVNVEKQADLLTTKMDNEFYNNNYERSYVEICGEFLLIGFSDSTNGIPHQVLYKMDSLFCNKPPAFECKLPAEIIFGPCVIGSRFYYFDATPFKENVGSISSFVELSNSPCYYDLNNKSNGTIILGNNMRCIEFTNIYIYWVIFKEIIEMLKVNF